MNSFKDVFKDCDRKFTQPLSRAHIFITQSLFNEHALVAGDRSQNFTNYVSEIKSANPTLRKFFVDLFLLMIKL